MTDIHVKLASFDKVDAFASFVGTMQTSILYGGRKFMYNPVAAFLVDHKADVETIKGRITMRDLLEKAVAVMKKDKEASPESLAKMHDAIRKLDSLGNEEVEKLSWYSPTKIFIAVKRAIQDFISHCRGTDKERQLARIEEQAEKPMWAYYNQHKPEEGAKKDVRSMDIPTNYTLEAWVFHVSQLTSRVLIPSGKSDGSYALNKPLLRKFVVETYTDKHESDKFRAIARNFPLLVQTEILNQAKKRVNEGDVKHSKSNRDYIDESGFVTHVMNEIPANIALSVEEQRQFLAIAQNQAEIETTVMLVANKLIGQRVARNIPKPIGDL